MTCRAAVCRLGLILGGPGLSLLGPEVAVHRGLAADDYPGREAVGCPGREVAGCRRTSAEPGAEERSQ